MADIPVIIFCYENPANFVFSAECKGQIKQLYFSSKKKT